MEQKSVLIGMSGGVDSSVAAALLKEQGYHVIGATMRLWTYSDSCNMKHEGCCAESAVEDARRVCDKLGIDFYVMNLKIPKTYIDSFRYFCIENQYLVSYLTSGNKQLLELSMNELAVTFNKKLSSEE